MNNKINKKYRNQGLSFDNQIYYQGSPEDLEGSLNLPASSSHFDNKSCLHENENEQQETPDETTTTISSEQDQDDSLVVTDHKGLNEDIDEIKLKSAQSSPAFSLLHPNPFDISHFSNEKSKKKKVPASELSTEPESAQISTNILSKTQSPKQDYQLSNDLSNDFSLRSYFNKLSTNMPNNLKSDVSPKLIPYHSIFNPDEMRLTLSETDTDHITNLYNYIQQLKILHNIDLQNVQETTNTRHHYELERIKADFDHKLKQVEVDQQQIIQNLNNKIGDLTSRIKDLTSHNDSISTKMQMDFHHKLNQVELNYKQIIEEQNIKIRQLTAKNEILSSNTDKDFNKQF